MLWVDWSAVLRIATKVSGPVNGRGGEELCITDRHCMVSKRIVCIGIASMHEGMS